MEANLISALIGSSSAIIVALISGHFTFKAAVRKEEKKTIKLKLHIENESVSLEGIDSKIDN